ncbi:MAG: 50S ribosomal protein L30 [Acidimicrobiia bacterium]|nr:50S ribosomal protein L30 [Acidimicrobiia bacterium]
MAKKLKITLLKSPIGQQPKTRATVRGLGLRKIRQSVEHADSPDIRGMIDRVRHLVEVEEQ